MRVAILNAGHMDYGGTERVVAYQARGLVGRGHEVAIFTPVNDPSVFKEVIPLGVAIGPWWRTLYFPVMKRTVNRLLHFWFGGKALKDYDVIVAHNQPGPYAAYKNRKETGKGYVAYIHAPWRRLYPREVDLATGWASDYRERLMFLRRDYWLEIDRESIQGASAWLVNSRKIQGEVKEVYGVDARLCPPGIEYDRCRNFPSDEAVTSASKYGADGDSLLVVGRHAPQKRLEWIPHIIRMVAVKRPEAKVIVTGRPNSVVTPKLTREAARLGVKERVILVGNVPEQDLIGLYHTCPVLLYNAVHEDFGIPPLEAMACGCVPVAWNEGAGPCETIVDGVNGLLARPYDLEDFAAKVVTLLEDDGLRRKMSERGVELAAKYDWKEHIDILEENLSHVASVGKGK